MKRIVRLTESDLTRIVRRVIREEEDNIENDIDVENNNYYPAPKNDLKSKIERAISDSTDNPKSAIDILRIIADKMERGQKMQNNVRRRFNYDK